MTALTRPAPAEAIEVCRPVGVNEADENSSPLRLSGEVKRRWRATASLSFHRLSVSLSEGCLVLRGRVSSHFLKQVAQAIALRAASGEVQRNEIEVDDDGAHDARPNEAVH